jgi:ATP-dependent helicase/nuclease subunit B
MSNRRLFDLLKELGGLAAAIPVMTLDAALQCLNELAGRTAFSPATGDAPVTVSALPADPVARYDGIWVAGLHAGEWPPPVQPDPFLPLRAQVAAGVPQASAHGRLEQARHLMSAWAAATDDLVLSSPTRDGDMELLPSPLLAELPQRPLARDGGSVWLPVRARQPSQLEAFVDDRGMPWPRERPLPSGVSSLNLQNECPFRAYAQLRLGSEPLEGPQPGVDAGSRGELLHAALEALWRQVRDQRSLIILSPAELTASIERCVTSAARSIWGEGQLAGPHARECRRAVRLIGELCAHEKEREPFSVAHAELETVLALAGAQLRLRIDRVDSLDAGGLAILDYKSGRPAPADWYGDRPSPIQLLAYLAATPGDVRAVANANITAREIRFDGIAARAGVLPRVPAAKGEEGADLWSARCASWRATLERIVGDFLAGAATVDPRPHACDYCHVASLCRIAELRAGLEDEEGADG